MNIIERLRIADISYHPLNFDAIKEIERLQARVAQIELENAELRKRNEWLHALFECKKLLKHGRL